MYSICLPRMPPAALISSVARIERRRGTVCSLMAITPEVEFRKPRVTVSPSTQVSADVHCTAAVVLAPASAVVSRMRAPTLSSSAALVCRLD